MRRSYVSSYTQRMFTKRFSYAPLKEWRHPSRPLSATASSERREFRLIFVLCACCPHKWFMYWEFIQVEERDGHKFLWKYLPLYELITMSVKSVVSLLSNSSWCFSFQREQSMHARQVHVHFHVYCDIRRKKWTKVILRKRIYYLRSTHEQKRRLKLKKSGKA